MSKVRMHNISNVVCFESDLGTLDERFFKFKNESKHSLVCLFCMNDFAVGEEVKLLASNFKLFPNTMIHRKCYEGEVSFHVIIEKYKAFKEFEIKYRYWL